MFTILSTVLFTGGSARTANWSQIDLQSIFTLRIVGPRIFKSKVRNHCAKKLVGALRKSTSFVSEFA